MRAVVQRVREASVSVDGREVSRIGPGMLVLIGIGHGDSPEDAAYLAGKCAGLRIFEDSDGVMNRSLRDTGGDLLLVSQFTLLGDARKGRRPSYAGAAPPEQARPLFTVCEEAFRSVCPRVETGVFGADMQVALVNDGPVTILLDSKKEF
ncbi:MAG: D-tyrosyl-tRNA(Tyr) deacylase [Clostridia bacterium]|nr:D-tyrosyl-tRNA(Tyr) deacylase [Clostridia bacterium]